MRYDLGLQDDDLQVELRDKKGTHINHPKVRMEKVTYITIESSEWLLVHADGELLGECPASFWLIPNALSIVA